MIQMADRACSSILWRSALPLVVTAGAVNLPGCASALPVGFEEEAPDGRIHAIVDTARDEDSSKIPDLVAQLDSDDPAVRMFAIRALERLTDQTLGFHHADAPLDREQAIERWVRWLAGDPEPQGLAVEGRAP